MKWCLPKICLFSVFHFWTQNTHTKHVLTKVCALTHTHTHFFYFFVLIHSRNAMECTSHFNLKTRLLYFFLTWLRTYITSTQIFAFNMNGDAIEAPSSTNQHEMKFSTPETKLIQKVEVKHMCPRFSPRYMRQDQQLASLRILLDVVQHVQYSGHVQSARGNGPVNLLSAQPRPLRRDTTCKQ